MYSADVLEANWPEEEQEEAGKLETWMNKKFGGEGYVEHHDLSLCHSRFGDDHRHVHSAADSGGEFPEAFD